MDSKNLTTLQALFLYHHHTVDAFEACITFFLFERNYYQINGFICFVFVMIFVGEQVLHYRSSPPWKIIMIRRREGEARRFPFEETLERSNRARVGCTFFRVLICLRVPGLICLCHSRFLRESDRGGNVLCWFYVELVYSIPPIG